MQENLNKIRGWFDLGIDSRALSLFRILLGLLSALTALELLPDAAFFLTDEGALPRALNHQIYPFYTYLSLHNGSGGTVWQLLLLLLLLTSSLAMALGWKARATTALTWLLAISLQNRNELMTVGFDEYLRLLLFWMIFLPSGLHFSPFSLPAEPKRIHGWPARGILLQICCVYWFSGLLKSGPAWADGTALYYLYEIDLVTGPLGKNLLQAPELLGMLSYLVRPLELFLPFLLLAAGPRFRWTGLTLLCALHLTVFTTLQLGLFPLLCLTAGLLFAPSSFRVDVPWRPYTTGQTPIAGPAAALALAYILFWNCATVFTVPERLPLWAKAPAYLLRLDQYWFTFAPEPAKTDGWLSLVEESGKTRELWNAGQVLGPGGKPLSVRSTFPSVRWVELIHGIATTAHPLVLDSFGRALCKRSQAGQLRLKFHLEPTPPPGGKTEVQVIPLWAGSCASGGSLPLRDAHSPRAGARPRSLPR